VRVAWRGGRRPVGVWLAQCAERRADLVREELRLFPGRKVAAPVDLVVVDQVGVGLLGPVPRGLIELAGEDAHASRDGDVLGVEEAEGVVPVQTSRGNPRVRRPVEGDVVEDLVSCKFACGVTARRWSASVPSMRTRTRPAVARTPGRSTAPAAWPGAGVRFAARPAAERLTERIMQRPDGHQMSATARRSPSPSPSDHLGAIRGMSGK
jgi:hypothetical protein